MTVYHLSHHGILGMRWGIRRYQNKDGSLTEEGRRRLGLDKYDREHNSDIVLTKGTKASRVVSTSRYDEYTPEYGGSEEKAKKYVDDILSKEKEYERKYISVDDIRNSGRHNGKDFYVSWFTNEGYDPTHAYLTMYDLKKDVRVASGKQVVDALLDEIGPNTITELLKNNYTINKMTMEYTNNRDLFDRVNKRFIDKGYDAIEDINDTDTDLPVIMFNSSKNLGKPSYIQTGEEAINDILKKQK